MKSMSVLRFVIAMTLAVLVAASGGTTTWHRGLVLAADSAQDSQLQFVGFIKSTSLKDADGSTQKQSRSLIMVGADAALGQVVVQSGGYFLYRIQTETLNQTGAVTSKLPYPAVTTALDSDLHRVYLGTAAPPSGTLAHPTPTSPSLETVAIDSPMKSLRVYTFPAAAAGQSVVALTPTVTANGQHLVMALLYRDTTGIPNEDGVVRSLTLYALDATKLVAGNADPEEWHYDITSCASLPSWSTSSTGAAREYLGVDPAGRFAYFGCRGQVENGTTRAALSPSGAVVVDFTPSAGQVGDLPASAKQFTTSFSAFGAPASFASTSGDQTRNLLLFGVIGGGQSNKLYVFDALHRAWTGSMPFAAAASTGGAVNANLYGVGVDSSTGRAYIYYPTTNLIASEVARLPVPQGDALSMGDLQNTSGTGAFPLVAPDTHEIFLPGSFTHADGTGYASDDTIAVFKDTRPMDSPVGSFDPDALTHQVPVTADTPVTYSASATAYGARAILVGGLHSLPGRSGRDLSAAAAADVACFDANLVPSQAPGGQEVPCYGLVPNTSDGNRAFTFGQVVQTEMSDSVAKADATSVSVDNDTTGTAAALSAYQPWNDVYSRAAPSGSPPPPTLPSCSDSTGAGSPCSVATDTLDQQLAPATCSDFGNERSASSTSGAAAACDFSGGQAGATAAVRGPLADAPIQVSYAASATNVGHATDNRSVTRAVAVARGILLQLPGGAVVAIGAVTTTATSAAGGLSGSAMSSFARSISDVTVTDPTGALAFSCGFDGSPCDPRALTDAVSAQSPSPIEFRTPSPDADPAVMGSPGGAQAEVIKSPYQFWNDYFTNADAGYEVPGLQIVIIGDQAQPSRLVLNLAGVHVESHFKIGVAPPPPPPLAAPSLRLSLTDGSVPAVPLAGAAFQVQGPEGTAPLACLTGADGVGTCTFTDLAPGSYTIHEATAPPGYAAAPDYQLALEAGQDYTTSFVNLPAIGSVQVSLSAAGDGGGPLAGGVFALFAGDSVLGTPLATCTTDAAGECGIEKVPLGDYTMHQVTAPEGYLVSDDVTFSLTEPAQVASLVFVDGIPGAPPVPPVVIPGKPPVPPVVIPGKPPVPPKVIPGKPPVPPRTVVLPALGGSGPLQPLSLDPGSSGQGGSAPVVASGPSGTLPALQLGGVGVPAGLARLVLHSPRQAVLLLFVWLVLGLPVYLWVRRRQFIIATERV